MSKTITLRLSEGAYAELKEVAVAEHRPLSSLMVMAALAKTREVQFVDDGEIAEILADERLVKRLRQGSHDAQCCKGRFVG